MVVKGAVKPPRSLYFVPLSGSVWFTRSAAVKDCVKIVHDSGREGVSVVHDPNQTPVRYDLVKITPRKRKTT